MNEFALMPETDPLGVLTSTLPVVQSASQVRIELDACDAVVRHHPDAEDGDAGWTDDLHFRDGTWRTAHWVLVLDALNFCFWTTNPDPARRWKIAYQSQLYDGYWALVAALRRAVDDGIELWNANWLASVTEDEVAAMLRPEPGYESIPLFDARVTNLRELGRGLLQLPSGKADCPPVVALIEKTEGAAVRLVQDIVERFPSFNDVALYEGKQVRFYKRAQILIADLVGAFGGSDLGAFHDLDKLTAFADYKVPQVLRRLGVLVYDHDLAEHIDRKQLIAPGSPEEVEIRAATIWACELLRREFERQDKPMHAFEVDWMLWHAGQQSTLDDRPYHRTLTQFY